MKVFGIGLNKTGTKTLGECFRILGYNNKSFDLKLLKAVARRDFYELFATCDLYDSFEDWPWPLAYQELNDHYPDAKFILTQRDDPETWYASLCKHAELTGPTEARKIVYGSEMPHLHKDHHLDFYQRHNADVIAYFKNFPDKLLVVSWENGNGWMEICNFLHINDVPGCPFPHKNRSQVK